MASSAKGRGRGRAALNTNGSGQVGSQSVQNDQNPGPVDPEDTCKCGMCNLVVGDEGIGCDRCSEWFHPSEMCMGLSKNSIHLIVESEDSAALLYLCTACRLKPGTGRWTRSQQRNSNKKDEIKDQLVLQLFQTVKGLCSEVAELTKKINSVFSQGQQTSQNQDEGCRSRSYSEVASVRLPQGQAQSGPAQPSQMQTSQSENQYRTLVRQEVREIQEREKRRNSLVIRGLTATTAAQVVSEFGDITSTMMGTRVTLSNVVKIPNNSGLWRAKLIDPDERKFVLERTKRLKGSQYDHIYIRKDLTYAQRMELKQRREAQAPPARGSTGQPTRATTDTGVAPEQVQGRSDVPAELSANTNQDNPDSVKRNTPIDRDSPDTSPQSVDVQQGPGTQNSQIKEAEPDNRESN